MHIPDNYLSPATCAAAAAIMVPIWALSISHVRRDTPKESIPLLGVGAAFVFLFMLLNVPLPGGSSGHAVGGTLIAVMLGPWAACLSVSVALFVQALLFGDGGILSFGANCLNMAVVLPFVGYYVYKLVSGNMGGNRGTLAGSAAGAYIGLNIAAFFTAVEFGIQPILFTDAQGLPLYSPYPLSLSVPAMMIPHLAIAGFVEMAFTVAVLAFILKVSPEAATAGPVSRPGPLYTAIVALILASPLGLLATGTAWGEWSTEELAGTIQKGTGTSGFIPSGMGSGFSFHSLFPDYSVPGIGVVSGYLISAVAGAAILIIIFKLLASLKTAKVR